MVLENKLKQFKFISFGGRWGVLDCCCSQCVPQKFPMGSQHLPQVSNVCLSTCSQIAPHFTPYLMHSQLLEGLKSESKYKTVEGEGVGARSLAHNTLKGRGACWSFEMGLKRVDKLYSLIRACTQPTQGG